MSIEKISVVYQDRFFLLLLSQMVNVIYLKLVGTERKKSNMRTLDFL